jgi:hypothetical protein
MKPTLKGGALFGKMAQSKFVQLTGQTYDNMRKRLERKKLPPLAFSKDEYRAHVLEALNGYTDGAIRCRYCKGFFTVTEIAADHAMPLSRGGSTGLDNLEFPCRACNNQKGSLTPDEFLTLLDFLEQVLPMGRQDVLRRLGMAVQLAAQVAQQTFMRKKRAKDAAAQADTEEAF